MTTVKSTMKIVVRNLSVAAPALLLIATPLHAADNALMPSWTGAYIGAHGGMNWRDVDFTSLQSGDHEGAQFGVHAGYNLGLGVVVLGIEGDASYDGSELDFTTANGGTAELSVDWAGSVRGRVGLPLGPFMAYATAGWAWTETKLVERTTSGATSTSEATISGPVYGLGVEAFILPGISARAEFLNYDYGTENFSFQDVSTGLQDTDLTDRVFRVGVSIQLN